MTPAKGGGGGKPGILSHPDPSDKKKDQNLKKETSNINTMKVKLEDLEQVSPSFFSMEAHKTSLNGKNVSF
jgi:hypothetical protein